MSAGRLWEVSVRISRGAEEAAVELFQEVFAQPPAVVVDERTKVTRVVVYPELSSSALSARCRDLRAKWTRLRSTSRVVGPCRLRVRPLKREDWAESWKRHFRPLEIGGVLLFRPGWSRRRPRRDQVEVVLDPGLSFGTGHHPTTGFCLRQLVSARDAVRPRSVLDAGTGSGILAIAAARLGYAPVEAFDADPAAVRVARANAARNRVLHRLRLRCQDLGRLPVRAPRRFDVVCANLTADLVVEHGRRLVNRVRPGGRLVVAGILRDQFAMVGRAFARLGLRLVRSRTGKEWKSGVFRVPPKSVA